MIADRPELSHIDLRDLIEDRVTAIRIPAYYPQDASAVVAEKLMGARLHGRYENAKEIGRVGQAFFESNASPEASERYRENAIHWIREIREAFAPHLTPIDRFRLELDEVWPAGAQLAKIDGRKLFVGLARTFARGARAEPHQDVFAWDAPDASEAQEVQAQLAMNVYLAMPEQGGNLVLWEESLTEREYEQRRIPGSYGLRLDAIPQPAATIAPEVGELILFKANKIHAVEEITAGTRVTWSCFVGHQGPDKPLVLWS